VKHLRECRQQFGAVNVLVVLINIRCEIGDVVVELLARIPFDIAAAIQVSRSSTSQPFCCDSILSPEPVQRWR
jgi:hypothetical protein